MSLSPCMNYTQMFFSVYWQSVIVQRNVWFWRMDVVCTCGWRTADTFLFDCFRSYVNQSFLSSTNAVPVFFVFICLVTLHVAFYFFFFVWYHCTSLFFVFFFSFGNIALCLFLSFFLSGNTALRFFFVIFVWYHLFLSLCWLSYIVFIFTFAELTFITFHLF